MTKDKARKQAARMRVAETGERYVVARRRVDGGLASEAPALVAERERGVLHRLTHRMPGVPEHAAAGERNRARAHAPHGQRSRQSRRLPNQGEPRVLIAWQHRIACLFGAE